MTAPLNWPAFQPPPQPLPSQLDYGRGVWGKVHGAGSDFRWIAYSDGFNRYGAGLERELILGIEDYPCKAFFWRPLPRNTRPVGYFAVVGYPSRAVDAAGRQGFLEKQVLEWPYTPALPAALGALLLLPAMTPWTDDLWWSRYREQPWSSPEFALSIAAAECMPVACSEALLADAIERGLRALTAVDAVNPETLQECYARLLAGQRPACLHGLSQPLAPEALAALLLPFDRKVADSLSLAGWIPSHRYSLEELGNRWELRVLPKAIGMPALSTKAERQLEAAGRMVEALWERKPGLLAATPTVTISVDTVREPQTFVEKAVAANPLSDPARPILPGALLTLTEPGPNVPSYIHELYEFARAVDRRWLDPASLEAGNPQGLIPLSIQSFEANLLCRWVREVELQCPYYADKEQWQVKVDLLRALALILVPDPDTPAQVGLPQSGRIPALLYAVLLKEPGARDALVALEENGLNKIIRQSLDCRMFQWMRSWLSDWRRQTSEELVRRVIDAVLD